MVEVRVNVEYKKAPAPSWRDSDQRALHVSDRMRLRGIGIMNIKDAINYGAKKMRDDGSIVAEYRWYKVVYREFKVEQFKKIYPITVLLEDEN